MWKVITNLQIWIYRIYLLGDCLIFRVVVYSSKYNDVWDVFTKMVPQCQIRHKKNLIPSLVLNILQSKRRDTEASRQAKRDKATCLRPGRRWAATLGTDLKAEVLAPWIQGQNCINFSATHLLRNNPMLCSLNHTAWK